MVSLACFVLRPENLEAVVASNLFADILSDLGGALAGSLGVVASASLDPQRRHPSMFEPVHGSAPDIAGNGIVSGALMLGNLGPEEEARRMNRAIEVTTGAGLLTPDLGGTSTTREVGDAVFAHLSRRPEPTQRDQGCGGQSGHRMEYLSSRLLLTRREDADDPQDVVASLRWWDSGPLRARNASASDRKSMSPDTTASAIRCNTQQARDYKTA